MALGGLIQCGKKTKESGAAPNFTLKTLDGREISLASLKGKVVLLDFWATWCSPCRESIPQLIDLYRGYQDKGLEVIGMNLDKGNLDGVQRFVTSMNIPYTILVASEDVVRDYGVTALPTTFLLDKEGRIQDKIIGFNSGFGKRVGAKVKELTSER